MTLLFREVLCAVVLFTFCVTVHGQDLQCDNDFDIKSYSYGKRFSAAAGGRTYDCSCRGRDCEQITCIRLQTTTELEHIGGLSGTCRDSETGRVYARGTTFLRPTRAGINMACVCSERGPPKIKCKRPQCVIPPPPPPTNADVNPNNGSCYDRHNDRWHPYNTPYIRRVVMSYAPDIIGEYKCICTAISTRCTAFDIPCCDSRTGSFVSKNTRFVAQLPGLLPMNCLCLGGRGRIGSCEELDDRREVEQSRRARRRMCLDPVSNRYYHEGSTFNQIRRSDERRCTCRRIRKRMKIVCNVT